MSFGGASRDGELFLIVDVSVHPSAEPDHEPDIHDEFDVEIFQQVIGGPNLRHVLVMNRALLEDFAEKAQAALEGLA